MELILAEKKKIVIEMYLKQENRRNIAKTVHLSFSTISKIINEYEGQKQPKPEKSNTAKAFSLFEDGASLIEVTIKLDIPPSEAEKIYTDYLRLQGKSDIVKHFDELEPYIPDFLRFVDVMKNNKTDKVKIKEVLDIETALQIQYKRMADQFHEQMRGVNEPVNSKGQITNPKELKPKEGYSGMYFD